jgi:hypothetical protein
MVLDVLTCQNVLVIMMVVITPLDKLSLLIVTPGKYQGIVEKAKNKYTNSCSRE